MYVKARGEDKFYPSGRHEAQWICNCDCNPNKDLLIVASNLNTKIFRSHAGVIIKKETDMIYQMNMELDLQTIQTLNFTLI